ncbi:MAG: HD-GYP domain-containing protein [Aminipila sp.]
MEGYKQMRLNFNNMLFALSYALDCVENEMKGVATNHGKRVAFLCVFMGKCLGLNREQIVDLAACAVLHDNALAEYIYSEYSYGANQLIDKENAQPIRHCILGEENVSKLPLCDEAQNAVLYHHENADGTGPFGKNEAETPIFAQLIHISDQIDGIWHLGSIDEENYKKALKFIEQNTGTLFSKQCVEVFVENINYDVITRLRDENIDKFLKAEVGESIREYSEEQIIHIIGIFANIIDYKSKFTMYHSVGVAKKAFEMSLHFGSDSITATKMFVAGALHDIGKLAISKDILEKPDKLTDIEYKNVQNHAYYTYNILKEIKGFEDITQWASLHHEKLNGRGYPFGKKAEELTFNARLMACLDVYQALTEDRPYKKGLSHKDSMEILNEMVTDGSLDEKIVIEIGKVYNNC